MGVIIELQPDAGPVLIVGGGNIALRKARTIAEGEFQFTVVAPEVVEPLRHLAFARVIEREFEDADIPGEPRWALVIACTNDRETNRRIGTLARAADIPVLVADRKEESTFFTPATIQDGELKIAVSTGGASPTLAKYIREKIVTALGPRWAGMVHAARVEREERLAQKRGRSE